MGSIQSTLYWDQNTSMPIAGSSWRGEQLSLLAKQLHARQSSGDFASLIEEAKSELDYIKEKASAKLKGDMRKAKTPIELIQLLAQVDQKAPSGKGKK